MSCALEQTIYYHTEVTKGLRNTCDNEKINILSADCISHFFFRINIIFIACILCEVTQISLQSHCYWTPGGSFLCSSRAYDGASALITADFTARKYQADAIKL